MLSIKERIQKFQMKHEKIDQKFFPEIWLTWNTGTEAKKKIYLYNTKTGFITNEELDWVFYTTVYGIRKIRSEKYYHNNDKIGIGFNYKNPKCIFNAKKYLNAIYMKYDGNLRVLEVSIVKMDAHRYNINLTPKENRRNWEKDTRWSTLYFVDGKRTPINEDGEEAKTFRYVDGTTTEIIRTPDFKLFLRNWKKIHLSSSFSTEFEKFAKENAFLSNGVKVNSHFAYCIAEWLTMKKKEDLNNKKNLYIKNLNYLIKTPVKEIQEIISIKAPKCNKNTWTYWFNSAFFIEKLTDENICFRYFYSSNTINSQERFMYECIRVFLVDGKVTIAKRCGKTEWANTSYRAITNYTIRWSLCLNLEILSELSITKYPTKILLSKEFNRETTKGYFNTYKLLNLVQYPIVEQIYNLGAKNIARALICSENTLRELQIFFGKIDLTEKKITKALGISINQLNYLESISVNTRNVAVVHFMKTILNQNSLNNLDKDTFKGLVNMILPLYSKGLVKIEKAKVVFKYPVEESTNAIGIPFKDFLFKIIKVANKTPSITQTVRDYFRESQVVLNGYEQCADILKDTFDNYFRLPETFRFNWHMENVKSFSDLERIHSLAIEYSILHQDEIRAQEEKEFALKMEKIDKNRKELEYEDENYLIRLPRKPSEIIDEGASLHHCVASYSSRHNNGTTNIFFLREKANPFKSFYTIELLEDANTKSIKDFSKKRFHVVQIHGFGNKWLGNAPKAIPFVMRWLKKFHISAPKEVLLSTSQSYSCRGAALIEEPII